MTTAGQPSIVIYTHPDCTFSAAAKMDFRRRRIAYTEVDLGKNPERIPDLLKLSNGERVTPVIVENGKVTIGFNGGY
ncbi:MAG: glutaredoxin family protein [SAR202 cluster bacterium]|nr:glutaredoxin family protein [SAR202 cluster bacterium]